MAVRWGIIGCGDVTEVKSGPGFQNARGSELVAVMRRNGALAADYAQRHGVPRWYDDAQQLIDDPAVDAVYIATPVGSHLDYALRVCAAGKPCYVEKPMARSYREAMQMVQAFQAAGVPLFVAYYRRALDRFLKARDLVAEGRLGKVGSVSYSQTTTAYQKQKATSPSWRYSAASAGGGLFMDLGCHTLDILDFILGPLNDVEGVAGNVTQVCDVEDTVSMRFTVGPDRAVGAGIWNFAGAVNKERIVIDGTQGRLSLTTYGVEPVELHTVDGVERFDLPNPRHIQQPMIQSIVDALSGQAACASTGVSGARTSAVMDDVLQSYYGGREDAFWNRPESWPGYPDCIKTRQ